MLQGSEAEDEYSYRDTVTEVCAFIHGDNCYSMCILLHTQGIEEQEHAEETPSYEATKV